MSYSALRGIVSSDTLVSRARLLTSVRSEKNQLVFGWSGLLRLELSLRPLRIEPLS